MSLRVKLYAWGLCMISLAAVACASSTPPGATDANLAKAKKRPPGAELFQKECAGCHGNRGEGMSGNPAPWVLARCRSTSATRRPRRTRRCSSRRSTAPTSPWAPIRAGEFKTAQNVFDYVSTQMPLPKSKAGSLTPEQYWAVVNFMLVSHGVNVPQEASPPERRQRRDSASAVSCRFLALCPRAEDHFGDGDFPRHRVPRRQPAARLGFSLGCSSLRGRALPTRRRMMLGHAISADAGGFRSAPSLRARARARARGSRGGGASSGDRTGKATRLPDGWALRDLPPCPRAVACRLPLRAWRQRFCPRCSRPAASATASSATRRSKPCASAASSSATA